LSDKSSKIQLEPKENLQSNLTRLLGIEVPDNFIIELGKFDIDKDGFVGEEEFEAAAVNGTFDGLIELSMS